MDEGNMELDENDMNDPDLLSAFDAIGGSNEDENTDSAALMKEDKSTVITTEKYMTQNIPTEVKPSQPTSSKIATNNVIITAEEAKAMAVKLSKEGKKEEALIWLRKAKAIEKGEDINQSVAVVEKKIQVANTVNPPPNRNSFQRMTSTRVNAQADKKRDVFSPLEDSLCDAIDKALRDAKKLKADDPRGAIDKMKDYKRYSQELEVLRSRRNIKGAIPPLFRYETKRSELKLENLDIGDDQLKLEINEVIELETVFATEKITSVTLNYDLGNET
jgi:hypothetical protein